jgi:PAS domain S-box-containing protein
MTRAKPNRRPGRDTALTDIRDEPVRCVVDARGDIVEASDGLLAALGYRREDVADLTVRRLVDPVHLATMLDLRRTATGSAATPAGSPPADTATARQHRMLLVTRGGGRVWADVELRAICHLDEPATEALLRLDPGEADGRTVELSHVLDAMTRAQVQFIEREDPARVYAGLLADFIDLTDSARGFIGDVLTDGSGAPFLRARAETNAAWDDAARDRPGPTVADGSELRDLQTPVAACLTSRAPVIANVPASDEGAGGLPAGHPPLVSFLALPVLHGDSMVGMVGVAGRPGGYDDALVELLGPLLATAAGITEAYRLRAGRLAVERQLEERDRILLTIVEHAPEIIYLKDVEGRYAVYNPAGAQILGRRSDEIVGRVDQDLFSADDAADVRREDVRVMEDRTTRTYESSFVVDGQRRTFLNRKSPWLADDGTVRGVIGVTTDITDRVQADEALERERELLARSESMLRGIIVSAGEGIVTSDMDGRILSFNPTAEAMFRYEEASVIGEPVEIIVPSETRARHAEGMRRRAKGIRGPDAGRWVRRIGLRSDGTTIPVEVFVGEVSRAEDRRLVALIRDLTEHVKIQEMKDDFVSVVSHELRTPLTSIQGALGLVLGGAGGELSPQLRELIEIAHDNSRRLVRLTNDLLDLQKLEAGRMTYRFVVSDLAEVARTTAAAMEPLATDREVRLDLVAPDDPLFASFDPDRMAQVLTNLVGNAVSVSDPGATVTMRVVAGDDAVGIDVEDRGPGIPEADRERVWEKFLRVESGAAARTHGTGIGLPLARALVEAHGGTIDFASHVGEGTTFHVRIPRRFGLV